MKTSHPIRSFSLAAVMLLPAHPLLAASPIALPSAPLYLAGGVAPNLVVTLDDSGSMTWGYVPDSMGVNAKRTCSVTGAAAEVSGSETKRYFLSGDHNAQYYNPALTYLLPLKYDGTPYSTSFGTAYANGFDTNSSKVNLATSYKPTYGYRPASVPTHCYAEHPITDTGSGKTFPSATDGVPAYYYRYETGAGTCTVAGISKTNEDCYVYTAVVGAIEQQNFANWYSFYRVRNLATVTAATRAFNNLPSTMRLAWQSLNSCNDFGSSTCNGWDDVSKDHRIRALSASHKQNFYDWMVRLPASGGTPLRDALGRVGEYFSTTSGTNNPYAEDPQVTEGTTQHSCRANYTILMTDGIWNGSGASNSKATGNVDGSAAKPFSDTTSGTLADVAYYYWNTDLRSGLTNNVPRNPRSLDNLTTIPATDYNNAKYDPANWQHMVTYTVGLGLTSFLSDVGLTWAGDTYTGSYPNLVSGVTLWPAAGSDKDENAADLWHAALNGRGLFFSAEDPQSLSDAMQDMVNNIISRNSSAASIATNSKRLDTSTNIYQASFDSGNWTGELEAFEVNSNGSLGASQWKASTKIPLAADRKIWTFNGTTGVEFSGAMLGLTADEVNYLRGDQTNEQSKGGTYRNRTSLLGDIINSDPLFVSTENFGYDKLSGTEGTDYITYVTGKSSKDPVIYVGANDGMLRAFNAILGWADNNPLVDSDGDGDKTNDKNDSVPIADSGKELFAYVPRLVSTNLLDLTKPSYGHKYYIDGAPTMSDVYYGGTAAWKTVLVTPLGTGGRGVFALDITKDVGKAATAFNGTTDVLWEFDGTNATAGSTTNDMGYPIGSAAIGRFNDGKYYAVIGNGYGSPNCTSALFMVQIDDPSKVKYFPTGVGACTTTGHNGMSTPSLVDYDGDRIIDAIFAGDLLGNLWKFDVTTGTWGNALGTQPMFKTASGQAITAPVEVGKAPAAASGKAMVYFGTGRYLLSGDESDKTKQAFYGLLDENKVVSSLQKQTIVYESATARVVSNNTVNWSSQQGWSLDLVLPPSGTLQGERVLSVPLLRFGRVIFNTSIPSADPCVLGGTGWLMELDAATGGNLNYSALDMNGDGLFNEGDYVTIGTDNKGNPIKSPVAGKQTGTMSLNQPTVITAGSKEYKFNSDVKKGITVTTEKSGTSNPRSSWRQLQ